MYQAIAASSTLGRKNELLAEIAGGRHLTTLAFSERGSRSQFWAPVSRLEATGDDNFVTSAQKSWVTSASHADSYVSTAQKPGAESPLESTMYLVDPKADGVQVEAGFDGLGLRGNDSAPVTLTNFVVCADRLLTELGAGAPMMLEVVLPWFVVGTAAMANGLCRAAVSATSKHLVAGQFAHDDTAPRDLPNLRARLAQMSVRTEQSRALLAHTAKAMEQPDEMTPLLVLQSRLAAIQAATDVTDLAMKACGGAAFSKHLGVERLFRDARRVGHGTHGRSSAGVRGQGSDGVTIVLTGRRSNGQLSVSEDSERSGPHPESGGLLDKGRHMADETIVLGAVAYDPKVVAIREGIRDYFNQSGAPFDFVLFSNYERQVTALLAGHIDIAWNTPLAHVRVQHHTQGQSLSLGMRDSDQDFHSRLIARSDSGIHGPGDLEGKTLAVGSRDSTQARILPLHFLKQAGVDLDTVRLLVFDTDVGKHGDTGTSELDVLEALRTGDAQTGTIGDLIWVLEQTAGHVDTSLLQSVWTSPGFDHCMFDALPDLDPGKIERFRTALFAMNWENPEHRRLLELEGLHEWKPPLEEGYDSLRVAVADQGYPL